MDKMMEGLMGGAGVPGGEGKEGEVDVDNLTDMLLNRFMDKELLYEPL